MSAGTLYIAVRGDTKELVSALKSAQSMSVKFGKDTKKSMEPVGQALDSLKRKVLALGASWVSFQGVKAIVQIADQYSLLDSKLKLATGSSEEFRAVYDELFRISQATGTSFAANATAFSGLSMAMKGTGVSSTELLSVFEDVNKSLIVAGASTQEASSFLLQFKQALGSNRLSGDEFKGMLEANSYWAGQFAKALDTDMAGLYKMKEAQQLTTKVVLDAHKRMAAGIADDFAGMQKTIARATVELSNAWNDVIADANRSTGATSSVAEAVSDLAKTITENKDGISSLFTGIIKTAGFAVEAISKVGDAWMHIYLMSEAQANGKSIGDIFMMSSEELSAWTKQNSTMSQGMKDLVAQRDAYLNTVEKYDRILQVREKLFATEQQEYTIAKAQVENLNAQIKSHNNVAVAVEKVTVAVKEQNNQHKVNTDNILKDYSSLDSAIKKFFDDVDSEGKEFLESEKNMFKRVDDELEKFFNGVDARVGIDNALEEYFDDVGRAAEENARELAKFGEELNAYLDYAGNDQLASELSRLEKKHQKMLEYAGHDMATQEKVAKWYKLKQAEIAKDAWKSQQDMLLSTGKLVDGMHAALLEIENDYTTMGDVAYDTFMGIRDTFREEVGDYLIEQFGGIGGKWGELWDNALARFGDYLADMVLRFAAAVAEMVAIWAATEFVQWWTGNESFSFGAIGGGGGSGGVGGQIASTVGSAAVSYAVEQYLGTSISEYIVSEVVAPLIAEATAAITGVSAATTAGITATGTGTVGTLTPTLLDAIAQAGSTTAANIAAQQAAMQGAEFAVDVGVQAGATASTGAGAGGVTAGSLTTSVVGAIPAILLAVDMLNQKSFGDYMSGANVTPDQLAATGLGDTLTMLQGPNGFPAINDALSSVFEPLGQFTQASYDAANGILVQTSAMRGDAGLIQSMNYAIQIFDQTTGRWQTHTSLMGHMVQTMDELAPQTEDAIKATAEYVAEMYGVPTVADELIAAFLGINDGVYSLGQAVTGVAGGLMSSVQMINGAVSSIGAGDRSRSDDTDAPVWQQEWIDEINQQSDFTGMKAGGGYIPAGKWGIAGEIGPEIINGPAHVMSTRDTASMLSGASSKEIRELKDVLISLGISITSYMQKSERIMTGWDRIGLPGARQ